MPPRSRRLSEPKRRKGAAARARLALLEGKGRNAAATGTSPLFGVRKVRIGADKRFSRHYRTDNASYTTDTTWWSFLPSSFYHHTYDVPIAWHLLVSFCNYALPAQDRFGTWYAMAPVAFILGYRILWDGILHLKTARRDAHQNRRMTSYLDYKARHFQPIRWEQLRVGDIICVRDGEEVPADIIFVASSHPDGLAYADTSGWLGSSELEVKQAVRETRSENSESALLGLSGNVQCPHPMEYVCMNRATLDTFTGNIKLRSYPRPTPLNASNLILRSTRILDVDHIYGIVIYCGRDTFVSRVPKIRTQKRGYLAQLLNRLSLVTLFLIFIALLIDSVRHGIWLSRDGFFQDLDGKENGSATGDFVILSLLRHLHLIPLVAIPSLDLQRFLQSKRINQDPRLGRMTPSGAFVPAKVNVPEVVEHLGTVDIAVFDKTGTITTGDLHFAACSVGLRDYGVVEGVNMTSAVLSETSNITTEPTQHSEDSFRETDSIMTPMGLEESSQKSSDLTSVASQLDDAEADEAGAKDPRKGQPGLHNAATHQQPPPLDKSREPDAQRADDADVSQARRPPLSRFSVVASPGLPPWLHNAAQHTQAKRRSASLVPSSSSLMPNRQVREAWARLRQVREQSDEESLSELPSCSDRRASSSTDEDEPPYRDLVNVRLMRHTGERASVLPPPRPVLVSGLARTSTSHQGPTPAQPRPQAPPTEAAEKIQAPAPLRKNKETSPHATTQSTTVLSRIHLARQQATLPPPCPGLLDPLYLPRPLTYPKHFRDDLNYVLNRNSLIFNDRSFFDAFAREDRQLTLTLHFCRALALCNSARPVFIASKLPKPLHVASENPRSSYRKSTIGYEEGRPSVRQRLIGNGDFCRRRPSNKTTGPRFDTSMGAPYLSVLDWHIAAAARRRSYDTGGDPSTMHLTNLEPVAEPAESGPVHLNREELWNPRYIGYLRIRAKKKEDICCAATAARLGFALVSRTDEYADLDINGQFRRFELLGTTNPNSRVTSIVCRQEDDYNATLYAKGSEAGIVQHSDLSPSQRRALRRRLRTFVRAGYRPVIFAYRSLSRAETKGFRKAYEDACASLYKASERFSKVCRRLNQRLRILAVAFLEDELMSGTAECFALLRQAGCATWILSGDKLSATVQAATCVGVVSPESRLFSVADVWRRIRERKHGLEVRRHTRDDSREPTASGADAEAAAAAAVGMEGNQAFMAQATSAQSTLTAQMMQPRKSALTEGGHQLRQELFELFAEFRRVRCKTVSTTMCCVFSSPVITAFLSRTELQTVFILMACESDAILCHGLTPPQKAAIVTVIQVCLSPSPVVMAVGDSIGDCEMLTAASIGVGISSQDAHNAGEPAGDFASNALDSTADIRLSSVAALRVLLVCHGIDILERNCRILHFCVFKSGLVGWAVFYYGFISTPDAHQLYTRDSMIPLILMIWTLCVPVFTLVYPPLAFPPNRNIAAAHYAASRARTHTKQASAFISVIDGFISSHIMMLCLVNIGCRTTIASDGTVHPALTEVISVLVVMLIFFRFVQYESILPVAPRSYIFIAGLLAFIPLLMGFVIYCCLVPISLEFFTQTQLLLSGLLALLILTSLFGLFVKFVTAMEPGSDTVAKLSHFSRMEADEMGGNSMQSIDNFDLDMPDVADIRHARTQLFASPDQVPERVVVVSSAEDESDTSGAISAELGDVAQPSMGPGEGRTVGIADIIRESVIFRVVSRLIPYTMLLYVNTKDLLVNDGASTMGLGAASLVADEAAEASVEDVLGKGKMSGEALSTVGGPETERNLASSTETIQSRDPRQAARMSFASAHRLGPSGAEEEVKDGTLIDDIVSVTSFNVVDDDAMLSDGMLESESEIASSSSESYDLASNSESDISHSMESLGSMRSADKSMQSEKLKVRKGVPRPSVATNRADSGVGLSSGKGTSHESSHRQPVAPDDEDINALLNKSRVRFRDQQLEEEYSELNASERQHFANCYRLFFVGCVLLSIAELYVQLTNKIFRRAIYMLPIIRLSVPVLFLVTSYSNWAWRHFDTLAFVEAVLMIVTYLPARFTSTPPCHTTGLFAIWTLIISRTPMSLSITLNCIWLFTTVLGDLFRYPGTELIYALSFNAGIVAFAMFAGQRVHVTQRRRFLLNHQAEISRRKQKEILTTMLPTFVVDKMLTHPINEDGIPEGLKAEDPGMVTVIFCDVYEFQNLVSILAATRLVELLDNLFLYFDKCAEQFEVCKIETVFETYLSCAGIRPGSGQQSVNPVKDAFNALDMSLAMLEVTTYTRYEIVESNEEGTEGENSSISSQSKTERLRVKIGMHSGSVTSGVVGAKKPQYALFGDTVNTASRMKLTGEPDHVHISDQTYHLLSADTSLSWQSRQLEVKGKGLMTTYLLTGVTGSLYPHYARLDMDDEVDLLADTGTLEEDAAAALDTRYRGDAQAKHQAPLPSNQLCMSASSQSATDCHRGLSRKQSSLLRLWLRRNQLSDFDRLLGQIKVVADLDLQSQRSFDISSLSDFPGSHSLGRLLPSPAKRNLEMSLKKISAERSARLDAAQTEISYVEELPRDDKQHWHGHPTSHTKEAGFLSFGNAFTLPTFGHLHRLYCEGRDLLLSKLAVKSATKRLYTSSSAEMTTTSDACETQKRHRHDTSRSAFPSNFATVIKSTFLHGSEQPPNMPSSSAEAESGPHRDLFARVNRRRGSRQSSLDPSSQPMTASSHLTESLEARGSQERQEVVYDDVDVVSSQASAFGMMKFSQSMNFLPLTFRSVELEAAFSRFVKRDPPYLRAIQSSIIIFLLVTSITSISRVYAEWSETLNSVIVTYFAPMADAENTPLFIEVDTEDDSVLGYVWIRALEMLFGFLVWLMFHTAMSRKRSRFQSSWAVDAVGFLYFLSMTVFLVTPTWRSVAERESDQPEWHWHSDTTELGFCFMALHHNSGILFHNLILIDLLILTLVLVFLSIVLAPSDDTRFTMSLAPVMFVFQMISAYVKEVFTRFTWFATQDFLSTEDRARELLADMLPRQVLEDFRADNLKLAYHHEKITFLFADIVGFTSYAKSVEAKDVVRLLQKLFARFDRDSTRFQLYKLCTIGDAYVAVSEPGVEGDENFNPVPGADKVWSMAKAMLRNIREVASEVNVPHLNMRIGLHFGQCVGGVIGSGRLRYDFWGMDVLTGNQMESAGSPGFVNCSETLKAFMEVSFPNRFEFEFNKTVNVLHLAVNSYFIHERMLLPEAVPENEIGRQRTTDKRRGGKRRLSMLSAMPEPPPPALKPAQAQAPSKSSSKKPGRNVTLQNAQITDLEQLRALYGELRLDTEEKAFMES